MCNSSTAAIYFILNYYNPYSEHHEPAEKDETSSRKDKSSSKSSASNKEDKKEDKKKEEGTLQKVTTPCELSFIFKPRKIRQALRNVYLHANLVIEEAAAKAEAVSKDLSTQQAVAVLGLALVAMGEDIGSEMLFRHFGHLLR